MAGGFFLAEPPGNSNNEPEHSERENSGSHGGQGRLSDCKAPQMQTCSCAIVFFEGHNRKLVKSYEWGYDTSKTVFRKENVIAVQSDNER